MSIAAPRQIMPLETIPDWEQRLARQDAFWQREIIDRPVVHITVPKQTPVRPYPRSRHGCPRDRWMDAEYCAEHALATVMNTEYLGDALPRACPDLGPDLFSAFLGCELEFDDETSWSRPNLLEWSAIDQVRFGTENAYWRAIIQITDVLLQVGRGSFYTAFPDLHAGADAIAAFRDPMQLNLDLIDNRDHVRDLLGYVTDTYLWVYEFFRGKLSGAEQATCTWANQVSTRRWFIPQSDFSCMVSRTMFEEVFLPYLLQELRHYECSLYHLDGPGALKHLDVLLDIPEVTAIQWVYGAGNGRCSDWLPVYRRIQEAGKGLELRHLEMDELDLFMEHLRPEGVWIGMAGVPDREAAAALLRKVDRWR